MGCAGVGGWRYAAGSVVCGGGSGGGDGEIGAPACADIMWTTAGASALLLLARSGPSTDVLWFGFVVLSGGDGGGAGADGRPGEPERRRQRADGREAGPGGGTGPGRHRCGAAAWRQAAGTTACWWAGAAGGCGSGPAGAGGRRWLPLRSGCCWSRDGVCGRQQVWADRLTTAGWLRSALRLLAERLQLAVRWRLQQWWRRWCWRWWPAWRNRAGDDNGREGKQAGPVEVLGRADTAAGRRRDGKLPKQPPATGPALQADAVAVQQVLEGGAGFRCGRTRQRRQLRGRTGRPGGLSRLMAARIVWWGDVYVGRRRDSQRTRCV